MVFFFLNYQSPKNTVPPGNVTAKRGCAVCSHGAHWCAAPSTGREKKGQPSPRTVSKERASPSTQGASDILVTC